MVCLEGLWPVELRVANQAKTTAKCTCNPTWHLGPLLRVNPQVPTIGA